MELPDPFYTTGLGLDFGMSDRLQQEQQASIVDRQQPSNTSRIFLGDADVQQP